MSNPFRPQLFPNQQVEPKDMNYPLIAMYKLDGVRCIIKEGNVLSRSLKPIPNKHLVEKLSDLASFSREKNVILDGELYSPDISFNKISGIVRSHDQEVPDSLNFWCFDMPSDKKFVNRIADVWETRTRLGTDLVKCPKSIPVHSAAVCNAFMQSALDDGYEGLILANPESRYKHGRITVNSGDGYKLKPYRTFDAQITGVVQATEVDPDAEKTINELGYSETSKKKGDRVLVEKAAAFVVIYCKEIDEEGDVCMPLKVMLAMTDEEKEEVWANRDSYVGRWVEYKGMLLGAKDLPRHPTFLRFREDKDD